MPPLTDFSESLDLFCVRTNFTHTQIREAHPDWAKCRYCNTEFSGIEALTQPAASSPDRPSSQRPIFSGAPYLPVSRPSAQTPTREVRYAAHRPLLWLAQR